MILAGALKALAIAFAFGTAATLVHAMVAPNSAQAGIGSAIKSAAKSVGGAAKTTAKGVGTAAKSVGTAAKSLGGVVTHPSGFVSAAKAGAAGVKQVGGTVIKYVPGVKGATKAVKAVADGKVKILGHGGKS